MAIYKHDGHKVVDEFVTLVNPGCRIPYYISELTGIYDHMVVNAPKFYEVAKQIVEITEGCHFVAHNAKFDYNFIRNAFKDLGYEYRRQTLCTVQLSRKYMPGHKSYSLGKLTKALGIKLTQHHRAAADALATVKLFEMLLQIDGNGFKKRSKKEQKVLDELGEHPVRQQVLQLPEVPGVYYFHDEEGTLVYVGKSKNIRSRVLTHLANFNTKKAMAMREALAEIRCVNTGSELLALLRESHEIKQLAPKFNQAQRRANYSWGLFCELQLDGYLHLRIGRVTDKNNPITTFTTKQSGLNYAERLMEQFGLCQRLSGLYNSNGACFNYTIKSCAGACVGEEDRDAYNERVQAAVGRIQYDLPSFLIVDSGRKSEERSVVYIKQHRYMGFGYVQEDELEDLEAMVACIQPYPDNRDVQQIIKGYLERNEVEKVIPLEYSESAYARTDRQTETTS